MRILVLTLATATALSGCAQWSSQVARDLDREVGTYGDQTLFGGSVGRNIAINEGAEGYRIELDRRFAADVTTMVNFEFNSAVLDAAAQATLRDQANFIRQFPEVRFSVYGHADAVGSSAYNRSLGLRRAQATVSYLVSQGVDRSRLQALVSLGETQPLVATPGRERANRRTVTEVAGFVEAGNPAPLNGRYAEIVFRDYVESAGVQATTQGISGAELATEN